MKKLQNLDLYLKENSTQFSTFPPLLPIVPARGSLRSLIFAPLEIFMIRGLVASILGFWPGAPEAPRFFEIEVGADAWLELLHIRCVYGHM